MFTFSNRPVRHVYMHASIHLMCWLHGCEIQVWNRWVNAHAYTKNPNWNRLIILSYIAVKHGYISDCSIRSIITIIMHGHQVYKKQRLSMQEFQRVYLHKRLNYFKLCWYKRLFKKIVKNYTMVQWKTWRIAKIRQFSFWTNFAVTACTRSGAANLFCASSLNNKRAHKRVTLTITNGMTAGANSAWPS